LLTAPTAETIVPTLRVAILGTRELLMHNGDLVDESNSVVSEIKKLTSLRKKTDAQKSDLARLSLIGSAYFDEDLAKETGKTVFRANLER
jgi:hypothetical protein